MKIKLHRLRDLAANKFKDTPKVPGVYFVRWSRNGNPVSILRLGGSDHKGILYIGKAKNLRKRVRRLWKGINQQESKRHTFAKTMIFCNVSKIIDLDEYGISWDELRTPKDAVEQEWAALKYYANKYKEPPPLNLFIGREFRHIFGISDKFPLRLSAEPDPFVKSIIDDC